MNADTIDLNNPLHLSERLSALKANSIGGTIEIFARPLHQRDYVWAPTTTPDFSTTARYRAPDPDWGPTPQPVPKRLPLNEMTLDKLGYDEIEMTAMRFRLTTQAMLAKRGVQVESIITLAKEEKPDMEAVRALLKVLLDALEVDWRDYSDSEFEPEWPEGWHIETMGGQHRIAEPQEGIQ